MNIIKSVILGIIVPLPYIIITKTFNIHPVLALLAALTPLTIASSSTNIKLIHMFVTLLVLIITWHPFFMLSFAYATILFILKHVI